MDNLIQTVEEEIRKVEDDIQAATVEQARATNKDDKDYWRKKEEQLRMKEGQLRMKEGQLREKELILLRAGAAAGLGVRSTSESAGSGAPAPRRLVDSAAKLHQLPDSDIWELQYCTSVVLYVDTAGVLDSIRAWAETAMMAAVDKLRSHAPGALLVSGLVKTGKSYALEHVVPAVVAEALRKQGGKGPLAGMVVLRLRGDELRRQEGATNMLRSLLRVLLDWARKEHVPMREGEIQHAQDVLAQPSFTNEPDMPGRAVQNFLEAVEVPVLVLCDEVQSLFLPTIGGKLDASGAEYIRDTFMKQLLAYGPHTMLWCLTGSSMAQTWISLANMPPNGATVILSARAVNLPATFSIEHMSLAWKLLQDRFPHVPLDHNLLELCPPSIALLAFLVEGWIDAGHPKDVAAFVRGFMSSKLVDESLKEWKLSLETMPLSQRITILDLSFPGVGARINTDLHPGLRRFLEPHLDKTVDGRYYLRDSHQRQIVRLLFNKDGTLRESWSILEFSATLTQLDGGWNLLNLGETADYLLGPYASRRWERKKPPAGMDEFKAKMQAIANEVANKLASDQGGAALGPQELWERQPWFKKVLLSEWNDRDCAAYMDNKQARCTHLAMLVFYLRLSRNVLAHMKPWDREDGVTVDVNVIEALPRVLGQRLFVFNDVMVGALRVLSRHTVEEAAAEAKLSGGGGSTEGCAEREGSSSSGLSSGTGGSSGTGTGSSSSSGLSSGTGGSSHGRCGSSSGRGHSGGRGRGGERGRGSGRGRSGGRGRGIRAMADKCAPTAPGPAADHILPLVHATGRHGVRGQRGLRAAAFAPRLRVQLSLFAPSAAVGLRLPW